MGSPQGLRDDRLPAGYTLQSCLLLSSPGTMQKIIFSLLLIVALAVPATPASADVRDSAEGGFSIVHELTIAAPRATVYGAFVDNVGEWWSSDHTFSGNAANLYMTAEPNGCFCERLGREGGVVHMAVTFVNPGVMLRLTGGLGPLGLLGVNGNMTLEFDAHDGRDDVTNLKLTYIVGGYRPGGLDELAPPVDYVLQVQLDRFREFVEGE